VTIDWDKIKKFLRSKSGICNSTNDNSELVCRCFNCETHYKKQKGHLYVKVDNGYPVFNCFKCESKGTVDTLISKFGGNPSDFIDGPIDFKKSFIFSGNSNEHRVNTKFLKINNKKTNVSYSNKLDYLNSRLGMNVNIDSIPGLVLSVKDFIKDNNIVIDNWNSRNIDMYENNFIGFLTNNKNKLILRNCDQTSDFRYAKISLNSNRDFYGILNKEEYILNPIIVLCEGIFDLLTFYFSKDSNKKCLKDYIAWCSILGNNYYTTLSIVLDYFCLPKSKVVILSDDNISESRYYSLITHPRVSGVEVYWNEYGKDFGTLPINPVKSTTIEKPKYNWRK
jgi:hypothetical protein